MALSEFNLLVIDDDDLLRESIPLITPDTWKAHCFENYKEDKVNFTVHAALVDMHLTDSQSAEGLKVVKKLHDKYPHLEIVAMSGDLNRELMEHCLAAGASRFLAKPLNPEEVQLVLKKIESLFLLQMATRRSLQKKIHWVGDSSASLKVKKQIASLRGEKSPILLSGESGTGKEVIAQLLSEQNSEGPFIAFNVAAIPENLFESELFGHVKGSFTGADQNKMGLAEAANGGVLFIDEIEALPLNQQVKLLRFLESGEVKRVGSKETIHVNCQVVIATNRDLDDMVKAGEFREDLLWRIKGNTIKLPTLRERKEDIPALCKHFFSQDRARQKVLSDDAVEALKNYDWPGNIRELKRCCEQLIVNSPLPVVRGDDVKTILTPKTEIAATFDKINLADGLQQLVAQYEAQVIAKAREEYKDIEEAAKLLKISRSSLYKKIKDHGIDWRQ